MLYSSLDALLKLSKTDDISTKTVPIFLFTICSNERKLNVTIKMVRYERPFNLKKNIYNICQGELGTVFDPL